MDMHVYQVNPYTLTFADQSDSYVANLVNKAILRVSSSIQECFERYESPKLRQGDIKLLVSQNFLLPISISPREYVRKWYDAQFNGERAEVILLTTSRCNFRCSYCYQALRDAQTPDRSTIEKTVQVLEDSASRRSISNYHFIFFGGEPLLNQPYIHDFLRAINRKSRKFDVTVSLITNGYYLNKDLVSLLCDNGLQAIEVTLDGPERIHDLRRGEVTSKGTYKVIISNIEKLSECSRSYRLVIRTNLDRQNIDHYPALLDDLDNRIDPVNTYLSLIPTKRTLYNLHDENDHVLSNGEIIFRFPSIFRQIIASRFNLFNTFETGPCVYNTKHGMVVNARGEIYSCPNMMRKDFDCIGSVHHPRDGVLLGVANTPAEACYACQFLPVCWSGCRYESLVRHGNVTRITCKKPLFEGLLKYYYIDWLHKHE